MSTEPPLPLWIRLSSVYLILPLLIFSAGWLRLWIAVPLLISVAASLGSLIFSPGLKSELSITPRDALLCFYIAAIAIGFAILNGLINFVPQSPDYIKHNLLLGDLIEKPWPVRYESGQYLCYGIGYYIVPAALAKVTGIASASVLGFIWATAGLALFFFGLARFFNYRPIVGILVCILCSGLGAFWWFLVKSGHFEQLLTPAQGGPWLGELLMDLGLYTSNLDSFTRTLYQPQHAISAWLGGIVMIELVRCGRWSESSVILAATTFWSPITSLGLAAICAAAWISNPKSLRLRPVLHIIAAAAIIATLAAYYLPHVPISESGFIWQFSNGISWLPWYLLFLLLFVAIPFSAILWIEMKHPYLGRLKPLVIGMVIILCLSPLYKFGHFGDMRMQLSAPAFLLLGIAMTLGIVRGPTQKSKIAYAYLCAVFLAGAIFPLLRTLENVTSGNSADYQISTLRKNKLLHITDLRMPGFDVTSQYLGKADSHAAIWLLKPER